MSRTSMEQVQAAADDVARLAGETGASVQRGSKSNGVAWSVRFGSNRRVVRLGRTASEAWNLLDGMRDALYVAEEAHSRKLQEFVVDVDPDQYADGDPGLLHTDCGEAICTVQTDDSLDVLARVAAGHECSNYRITRFYESDDYDTETVEDGLTLAEAQAHCNDPETSSTTATGAEGVARTAERGRWFDGYTNK